MEINLEKMHSPCQRCYNHYGFAYSPEDEICQYCEYTIMTKLFRSACSLLSGSCGYCRHYPEGCAAVEDKCNWEIDWEKAVKDFIKE